MPVVVMVMSVPALLVVDGAVVLVAMLAGGFKFEGCVGNTVLGKFFANGVLDVVRVSLGYHVEGCIIVVPIHTPNVDVVNVMHAFDMCQVLADFVHVDAVGCLFEKEINGFFEGADGVDEDKHRHTDGHQRVDDGNIGKTHDDGSHEDNQPAEDVLKHVEIHRLLVKRVPFPCKERREEVDRRTDDGEDDHSVVVNGCGMDDANNGIVDNKNRADQKDERGQHTSNNRVTRVAVGKVFIGLLFALFFKKI